MSPAAGADCYAVVGNPVAHSKSPQIHALFAAQTGQNIRYDAVLIAPGEFAAGVDRLREQGLRGLNITLPFKQDAWRYAAKLSAAAERAEAVNTLMFCADHVYGHNTDGPGLVRDLKINHGAVLGAKQILVLGAGGAARGVLQPLLAELPGRLVIANRTLSKAQTLARLFGDLGAVEGISLDALKGRSFDLIINATSASLDGRIPQLPQRVLREGGWCYDLMYADKPTAFVRWGLQQNAAKALDGLGMLVEQAAESFALWRGTRPETAAVIAALRGD